MARVSNDVDDTFGDADLAATDGEDGVPTFGDADPEVPLVGVIKLLLEACGRGDAARLSLLLPIKPPDFDSGARGDLASSIDDEVSFSSRSSSSNRSSGSSSSSGSLDDGLSLNFGNFDDPLTDGGTDDDDTSIGVESALVIAGVDGMDASPNALLLPGLGVVGVPELEPEAGNDEGINDDGRGVVPASILESPLVVVDPGTIIFGITIRPIIV
jgi:hypothetical protein